MEAVAISSQVKEIAKSLTNDDKKIDGEVRTRTLKFLLELKRLEMMTAIAQGKNKSTYFFGDGGKLPA